MTPDGGDRRVRGLNPTSYPPQYITVAVIHTYVLLQRIQTEIEAYGVSGLVIYRPASPLPTHETKRCTKLVLDMDMTKTLEQIT